MKKERPYYYATYVYFFTLLITQDFGHDQFGKGLWM